MRHLNDIILAVPKGPRVAACIKHLDMFGVIGIIGFGDIKVMIDWVKQHVPNVRFSEERGLIWMPTIGEVLDRQLSGLKQRPQYALPAPSPLVPWKSDIKDI